MAEGRLEKRLGSHPMTKVILDIGHIIQQGILFKKKRPKAALEMTVVTSHDKIILDSEHIIQQGVLLKNFILYHVNM